MGETTNGKGIRSFWPDDTDTEMYFSPGSANLGYILERAREKWGGEINIDELEIHADYIHTDCLGYDQYDPGDYTNFVRVTYE